MDPITWIFLIMSMAAAAQANETARKQSNAVTRAAQLAETDRVRQEGEFRRQGVAQMNEEARQAQADMALFDTVAGESGGGNSVTRARNVAQIGQQERSATIAENSRLALTQIGFDGIAGRARADSQLASISRPSVLGTALSIGSVYMQGKSYQSKTKKPAATT